MNTSSEPATTPGRLSGSTTFQKTDHGRAPRLAAASSSAGSMFWITLARTRIMNGRATSVSAITTAAA